MPRGVLPRDHDRRVTPFEEPELGVVGVGVVAGTGGGTVATGVVGVAGVVTGAGAAGAGPRFGAVEFVERIVADVPLPFSWPAFATGDVRGVPAAGSAAGTAGVGGAPVASGCAAPPDSGATGAFEIELSAIPAC
ncbi:MAG TPA: hypothetical protein VK139_00965 [Microbacteriaceae bacterium]|nr:hypothetical protein [Microbacteriaceae bacterium]